MVALCCLYLDLVVFPFCSRLLSLLLKTSFPSVQDLSPLTRHLIRYTIPLEACRPKENFLALLQEQSIALGSSQPRKMREPMQETYILEIVTLVLLKEMTIAASLR